MGNSLLLTELKLEHDWCLAYSINDKSILNLVRVLLAVQISNKVGEFSAACCSDIGWLDLWIGLVIMRIWPPPTEPTT